MKSLLQLFRRHPIAIIVLTLYTLLCVRLVVVDLQFKVRLKEHPEISGIANGGEGVAYATIFLFIVGAVFFLITCGYAIGKPKDTKFYLWLIFIIVTESITTFNIG